MIPPPYGGVSVYLRRLIENLGNDGFTVGGYYVTSEEKSIVESPLFDRWSWFETVKYPWKVFRYLHQLSKYYILHSHMGLEAMVYLWTFKKVLKKKIVITVHNTMVENYFVGTNIINAYFLRRMAEDDGVVWIAVSQEGKKQLEKLPLSFRSEIQVISPYIPEPEQSVPLNKDLSEFMNHHDSNIAFYGHSFMLNKGEDIYGFREMLEIFKCLSDVMPGVGLVYCMADVSDSAAVSELERYAKDLGINKQIYWQRGSLPSLQLLWETVDVYVRPTSTDGDSVAVREAIESGAQVVTTDVVNRPDECLVYHKGSISMATDRIMDALRLGRRPVTKDYSHYEIMKSVYRGLLAK